MAKMEFWLSYNNREEVLQLPVPPPNFNITQGNINTVVNIESVGEINLIGKGKLASISISSFFPSQIYSFCQYTSFPKPYDCVNLIEKWRKTSRPIRLVITRTNINLPVTIESFSYGEKDGSGDIYFTLELKEYKFITTKVIAPVTTSTGITTSTVTTAARTEKTPDTTYTVKKGDTLWEIAKRLTGKGENYKAIATANNIKNPNKISVGQVLKIATN